jgi:hypothetical protein
VDVIELGKAGSTGVKGAAPVLRDGETVATLRASNWKESATAVVDGHDWIFAKQGRELFGRRADDPEGAARFAARQTSFWKGTWSMTLEGTPVEMRTVSHWKGTRSYLVGERQVAESGPRSGWSPRPSVQVDSALPMPQQVFLLWFELIVNRRNQAALTAAVAGGAVAGGSS